MNKLLYLLAFAVCYANGLTEIEQSNGERIINGNLALEGQFPYMVSIQQIQTAGTVSELRGHRCGGVLVTFLHVVTSASCLHNYTPGYAPVLINPTQYRVFSGAVLLSNENVNRIRTIQTITVHENFTHPPAYLNDIAIITLATPYANVTVVPLQVFSNSSTFAPPDFSECTVAGWGSLNAVTTASPQLRWAQKYVYNQGLCKQANNLAITSPNIHPSMICAASHNILSVGCVGDSGNPLVCDGMLTGILFGYNCAPTSLPELYTRVSNYSEWIRTVSAAPTFSSSIYTLALFAILQFIVTKIVY